MDFNYPLSTAELTPFRFASVRKCAEEHKRTKKDKHQAVPQITPQKLAAFTFTRKTDVLTALSDLLLDSVQRMRHGGPEEHIAPLEDDEDDDQVMSEPAGEVESGARGPAVEIQVICPSTEPQF